LEEVRMTPSSIPAVLSIAGSDPSGGAGIQADQKTLTTLDVYGTGVITAITAQNTSGVYQVWPLPAQAVAQQIDAVMAECRAEIWKTGMLTNAAIVRTVREKWEEYRPRSLIVDPVLTASDGTELLSTEGLQVLKTDLLPLAYLVTPNIPEASSLTNMEIKDLEDMKEAARRISSFGVGHVLLKGGHLSGPPIDLLYDGREFREFLGERLPKEVHGTGCALATAIAAGLAKGQDLITAIIQARDYLSKLLKGSLSFNGKGYLLHHSWPLQREAQRYSLLQRMKQALEILRSRKIGRLIPEVQSNLGMALTEAQDPQDIVAVPGRIVRLREDIGWLRPPEFGCSRHIANIILTILQYSPQHRAAMNIRYHPEILGAARRLGYKIGSFSRDKEPEEVLEVEGKSLSWGVSKAIEELGTVPDLIYDLGGPGKEAMIRVIGLDIEDVVQKILNLQEELGEDQPGGL